MNTEMTWEILGSSYAGLMDMETIKQIITQPFTWGLLVGLFLMIVIWRLKRKDIKLLRLEKKRLLEENKELQGHLNTQLKISGAGNEHLQSELDKLREQNQTLRANLHEANQKPGRSEIRHLHIMEDAVSSMREQAPGFAPAWEKALREAEIRHDEAEGGLKKFVRKLIPMQRASSQRLIDDSSHSKSSQNEDKEETS